MPKKKKARKKTLKSNGHNYNLVSCKGAKTKANKARKLGYLARVQNGCYYRGPKRR